MKKFFLLLLIPFLFVSCATKEIPRAYVVPSLVAVDRSVNESVKLTKEATKAITGQSKVIGEQKQELAKATGLAKTIKDKVKDNLGVTQQEADDLLELLQSVEARNLFIEDGNRDLSSINTQQVAIGDRLKDEAVIAIDNAFKKEEETDQLRDKVGKQEVKLGILSVYRNWIITAVVGLLFFIIIKVLIGIYKPF